MSMYRVLKRCLPRSIKFPAERSATLSWALRGRPGSHEGVQGKPALDAGLLAAAQAVEHYEIARYGTLKTWAAELGFNQAVKLLEQTLAEEKETDRTLTELAESSVNQHAEAA